MLTKSGKLLVSILVERWLAACRRFDPFLYINQYRFIMNYPLIALVILIAIAIVVFLAWKDQQDKKKIEKEMNQTDIKPEKHKDNKSGI
jgi:hypothetical protein